MKKLFMLGAFLGVFTLSAAPLVPDENTLLLAGFENGVERADYSTGPAYFMGIGALQDTGYYGKGLNARQRYPHPDPDFSGRARSPMFTRWSILMHGNVLPDEGTFEFFVKLRRSARGPQLYGNTMINSFLGRFTDDGGAYFGAQVHLTPKKLSWRIPLWSRDSRDFWGGSCAFPEGLAENWHHFAIVWRPGEAAIYLDGRLVATCDLKGKLGLNLLNNLQDGLCMHGFVFDELRISDIARYTGNFEPNWRDGKRPAYAFAGNPGVKRYPASSRKPARVQAFPAEEAVMVNGIPAALAVFDGFERKRLESAGPELKSGKFSQKFNSGSNSSVNVTGKEIKLNPDSTLLELEFANTGRDIRRLEVQLGLKMPFKASSYFDGLEQRRKLQFPRFRDSYAMVLPLAAVADKDNFISCGLSPRFPYNDIIHGFMPEDSLWNGTRFELAPGEKFTVTFYISRGRSSFGTAAALDRYYSDFGDLYKKLPNGTVYNYLGVTGHWRSNPPRDIQRQAFAGGYWGHGPYHTKGDGSGRFWNMEKYKNEKSYRHAVSWEKLMIVPENIPPAIAFESRYEFDRGVAVRRYHATPDLTPEWLIKEVDPNLKHRDDPLTTGHYYKRINGNYFTNEYNTPLGKLFLEETEKYLTNTQGYSPGFINDVIYADSVMRYFDPVAQRTPGRSFAPDFGAFVRGAMGKWQRWNFTSGLLVRNRWPGSWVSDGGFFSYTLGAVSCQAAVEARMLYTFISGLSYMKYGRQLYGEKTLSTHTKATALDFSRYIDTDQISAAMLRDMLRATEKQLILFALEHAILLEPAAYPVGKQKIMEAMPLITEASLRGRKAVPGGWISEALWLKRSGDGVKGLLIAGNREARKCAGKLTLDNSIWQGVPVLFKYYGGRSKGEAADGRTRIDFEIAARSPEAWLTAVILDDPGKCQMQTECSGNGLEFVLSADIEAEKATGFRYDDFAPLYRAEVTVNGRKSDVIPAGRSRLLIRYRTERLKFSDKELAAVELFKNGKVNFRLIADPGWTVNWLYYRGLKLGFDRGTAGLLDDFAVQYDWENGIAGDLGRPEWRAQIDPGYDGWQFILNSAAKVNQVKIDTRRRLIILEGTTPGEARRTMMIFLRMLDRRYPHIGPQIPLNAGDKISGINAPYLLKANTSVQRKFNAKFAAKNFLGQPLLDRKYEHLYSRNADFTGRYQLKYQPFIFEPTYADDFVHGYSGDTPQWKKFLETHPGIKRNKLEK